MPEIGVPQRPNPFQNVRMAEGAERERNLGEKLNKMAGKDDLKIIERGAKHNQMGKDEFMKLLAYQMQNQDPMNPADQTKLTAELAQFSQLEQVTNMREDIKKLNENKSMELKSIAASFLGKKIMTEGINLSFDGKSEPSFFMSLDNPAKKILARVLDSQGNVVANIEKENLSPGTHQIQWDGVALDGRNAPVGEYKIFVQAWDEGFNVAPVKTKVEGVVSHVEFEGGSPIFTVGGRKVSLADVTSFSLDGQKSAKPAGGTPVNVGMPIGAGNPASMQAQKDAAVESYKKMLETRVQ